MRTIVAVFLDDEGGGFYHVGSVSAGPDVDVAEECFGVLYDRWRALNEDADHQDWDAFLKWLCNGSGLDFQFPDSEVTYAKIRA